MNFPTFFRLLPKSKCCRGYGHRSARCVHSLSNASRNFARTNIGQFNEPALLNRSWPCSSLLLWPNARIIRFNCGKSKNMHCAQFSTASSTQRWFGWIFLEKKTHLNLFKVDLLDKRININKCVVNNDKMNCQNIEIEEFISSTFLVVTYLIHLWVLFS